MIVGEANDVMQTVWARLLVREGDRPARLADYSGRASLRTWLRVVMSREALSALRRRRDVALDDEVLVGRLVTSHDPSLALIGAQSSQQVKSAFEDSVAALSTRERNLLRQHLLDGLTIDELGALYRVHRATAARWLASAREAVWTTTQRSLRERLALWCPTSRACSTRCATGSISPSSACSSSSRAASRRPAGRTARASPSQRDRARSGDRRDPA